MTNSVKIKMLNQPLEQTWDQLARQVRSQVQYLVENQLLITIHDQVRRQVWD